MIDRALERVYSRAGPRLLALPFVAIVLAAIPTGVLSALALGRCLGLSAADMLWASWVFGGPILLAGAAAGTVKLRAPVRTILAWDPSVADERSVIETWTAVVRLPRTALGAMPLGAVAIFVSLIAFAIHFHVASWAIVLLVAWDAVLLLAGAVVILFAGDLFLRPMLADVAARLPAGFEPELQGPGFRIRALAPLPVIAFYGVLLVGAYGNAVHSGPGRLAFILGLALVAIVVATAGFTLVSRSVTDPVDQLVAATRRVRAGDLSGSLHVKSADELGQLTSSFNEMLAGLREREALHAELRASRERIVSAADSERRRVERDLHDGAQQQLVLAQLKLGRVATMVEADPVGSRNSIAEIRADLATALSELRDLARGIYPARLESDGLGGALSDAAQTAAIQTTVDVNGVGRYGAELESAVYFCCLEALQNAGKHAGPEARASIELTADEVTLGFVVADDGAGFDPATAGYSSGLQNIADRIGALGGVVEIGSSPGHGTTISGRVPVGAR